MGVTAAVVAVGSAVAGAKVANDAETKQRKAAKAAQAEREEAADKQDRLGEISARRERLSAIRESRIKQASLKSQAEGLGVSGSSGVLGGVSSLGSQLGSNIAFSETTAAFGKSIGGDLLQASQIESNAAVDMAKSQSDIAMIGAVGSIAGQFADYSSLGETFNTNPGISPLSSGQPSLGVDFSSVPSSSSFGSVDLSKGSSGFGVKLR